MNEFLAVELLYLMDFEDVRPVYKLSLVHDMLVEELSNIFNNQFNEVMRIYRLAAPYLWEHYEAVGATGLREQEMIARARAATRAAIRGALHRCRLEQVKRAKAQRPGASVQPAAQVHGGDVQPDGGASQ